MVFSNDEGNENGYWVAIKLNWVNHGHFIIDVSEVNWHITLAYFTIRLTEEDLASLIKEINEDWDVWRVLDLVINGMTTMEVEECIMWEFNTSPKSKSDCWVVVKSQQKIKNYCGPYKPLPALTKTPRLHVSQWNIKRQSVAFGGHRQHSMKMGGK